MTSLCPLCALWLFILRKPQWQVSSGKVENKSQNVLLPHRFPIDAHWPEDPFPGGFFRRRAESGMTADGFRLDHPPVLVNGYRHLNRSRGVHPPCHWRINRRHFGQRVTRGDTLRHTGRKGGLRRRLIYGFNRRYPRHAQKRRRLGVEKLRLAIQSYLRQRDDILLFPFTLLFPFNRRLYGGLVTQKLRQFAQPLNALELTATLDGGEMEFGLHR